MATTCELRAVVLRVLCDVLDRGRVDLQQSFFDLGGTSLDGMRICARLSRALQVQLDPDALFEFETIGDFIEAVTRKVPGAPRHVSTQGGDASLDPEEDSEASAREGPVP